MTEAEWLASDDPGAMLELLEEAGGESSNRPRNPPSGRKPRLFSVACCRTLPAGDHDLASVRAAEAFADGVTTDTIRNLAWIHAANNAREAFKHLCAHTQRHGYQLRRALASCDGDQAEGRRAFARLLRDIVGNPFRQVKLPFVRIGSGPCPDCPDGEPDDYCDDCSGDGTVAVWGCPWLTPTVVGLAQAAYGSRDEATGHIDPLTLAAVADALEEAGCIEECPRCKGSGRVWNGGLPGDPGLPAGHVPCRPTLTSPGPCIGRRPHPLLAHLRDPGPHVRGCWAVDLLTGRE